MSWYLSTQQSQTSLILWTLPAFTLHTPIHPSIPAVRTWVVVSQKPYGVLISVHLHLHERDVVIGQNAQSVLQPPLCHDRLPFLLCHLFAAITDVVQSVAQVLQEQETISRTGHHRCRADSHRGPTKKRDDKSYRQHRCRTDNHRGTTRTRDDKSYRTSQMSRRQS